MTPTEFVTRYPEFAATPNSTLLSVIAEQEILVSDSWGAKRPQVLALTVADALSRSPNGRQSRLNVETNQTQTETPYAGALKELKKAHAWLRNRF